MKKLEKNISGIPPSRLLHLLDRTFVEGIFYYVNNEVTYANQTFLNLFGFNSFDDLHHFKTSSLFIDVQAPAKMLSKANKYGIVKDEVLQLVRKDSTTFWGSLTIEKIEDSKGIYYVGTLSNVTDRLQGERALREKNADLKKVNEQMDRFLYSASHDFRQPLTSMMGLIRLMRMDSKKEDTELYLEKLDQSVAKLDTFLREIMQFSRNSHERLISEQIDLKALIEAVFNKFSFHINAENIKFNLSTNKPLVFYSDMSRIEVIIQHLIKNSVEYADLSKNSPFINVIVTYQINQVIVEVIDNGIGISNAHLPKVCEMFYRGTDRSKGSGLGLYIVKEALLKLGGNITIDSEVNLGTIIHIEIPNGQKGRLINKKMSLLNEMYE